MEGQMILTNFFTAAKSRQNGHAAKRRKVAAEIDVIASKSAKLGDEKCASLNEEKVSSKATCVSRSTASSRTKQANRSITRASKTRSKAAQHKTVSEGVVSVTTSLEDDHGGKRSRKTTRKNNDFESSACKVIELASSTPDASKDVESSQCGQSEVKPSTNASREVKSTEVKSKISPPVTHTPEKSNPDTNQPANIRSQSRTGLKVNPWITEQAKVVLASRGRQALEKSLGKRKATSTSSKVVKDIQTVVKEAPLIEKSRSVKMNVPRLNEGMKACLATTPVSATDESGANLPAYKRFSHLLEAKKAKPSGVTQNLPLPYHFKVLEEMFRCIDVVLSLKQKRYETCTFEKLKDSVQEMCRKKFEKKHLAQMKAVYPTAFVFRQQNISCAQKKTGYQLTIDFNFDESCEQKPKDFKFIESSVLIARQKYFKNKLLKLTMSHHRVYLAKNYPSLSVKDEEIKRWHPCFPLDEVPEAEQSPLPEPPEFKTFSTAQDVLDQARLKLTPRVEKALNNVAKKSLQTNIAKAHVKINENKKDSNQSMNKNPSLKGVSQSLIDKIRQKEEMKIQESLTADSEDIQKRVMVQRFPELCRILKTYFVSERRAAIPLEDVSSKLAESYTSTLSSVQVEKHVKLLSEFAPEWLSIMYVRKCPYVKLKKNVNVNGLIEKFKSKSVN